MAAASLLPNVVHLLELVRDPAAATPDVAGTLGAMRHLQPGKAMKFDVPPQRDPSAELGWTARGATTENPTGCRGVQTRGWLGCSFA
jgi:hypothetical protein